MTINHSAGECRDEADRSGSSDAGDQDQPPERIGRGARASLSLAVRADRAERIDPAWLREHLERVLPLLTKPVERVSVECVSDARMRELHKQFCRIDETTDVLTFPADANGDAIDVDIAVCLDVAARRAAEFSHDVNLELLLYVVHGLLHCCGFDDHDEKAYHAMHAEEDRLLEAIGVGRLFAAGKRALNTQKQRK